MGYPKFKEIFDNYKPDFVSLDCTNKKDLSDLINNEGKDKKIGRAHV